MACTVNISEDAQKKYNLPKEMKEAEFYAWLANGGLQLLADAKEISIDGYKIENNKIEEILNASQSIIKFVKISIAELQKKIAKAKKEGAKEAISTVYFWQKEARSFLTENEIKSNKAIERAIGRIRDEKTYARFLLTVQSQQDAAMHFEKAEDIRGLLKEISKLKKSKNITANQKKFIDNISFPSPVGVFDLDTYANLLQEFLGRRKKGESAIGNVEERLKSFIDNENNYINYKRSVVEIDAALNDLALELEFDELNSQGVFEGTEIKTWQDYKAFFERVENQLNISEKDEEVIAKVGKSSKAKKVEKNIKTMLDSYGKEFKEAFDLASTDNMKRDFSLLENADLSIFSLKELILLSNVLDGILYDGDFMGYDYSFRSKLSQAKRKKELYEVLTDNLGNVRKLLNVTKKDKRGVPTTIKSQAFSSISESRLMSFVFGGWNSMIVKIQGIHTKTMNDFNKKMLSFGSKALESSTAVHAFGFINQYPEGLTYEEQQEEFENDTKVYAENAKKIYGQLIDAPNYSQEIKVDILKAKAALKALQRFGVIKDLVFDKKGVTYEMVEGVKREDIQGKLDAKEQSLYDYLIGVFEKNRPDFINGMEVGLGLPFRGIVNYFPRFSKMDIERDVAEEGENTIQSLLSDYSGVTRTQDRAKKRSRAAGSYSIGLREDFSKGYWQNLLIAEGQQEINDIINSIYSPKVGIKSLEIDKTLNSSTIMQNALISQVKKDLTYGNVNLKTENLIVNQLVRTISDKYYGYVLNHPNQLPKQLFPSLLTNFILSPKVSALTSRVLLNKNLANKILNNATINQRSYKSVINPDVKSYPPEYLVGTSVAPVRGIRIVSEKLKLGDIIKPMINAVRKSLGKEVKNENSIDVGDSFTSRFNIIAGYIDYLKKTNKGITDKEILNKIENENIDESALDAGETWQARLNSLSLPSQQGKDLSSSTTLASILYMFKSFQINTHQEFLKNLRRLTFNWSYLTPAERAENLKFATSYVVQQAIFRAGAAYLAQFTLAALAKRTDDDKEKEKIYLYEKTLTQFFLGVISDVFLGSAGVAGDIIASLIANEIWEFQKETYIEEIRKTNPNFDPKGTPLDPNKPLSIQPTLGGPVYAAYEFVEKEIKEWGKEAEILEKAGLPISSALMYPIIKLIAYLTGSGTLRDAGTALNNLENPKIDRINKINGALEGQFGYEFELEDKKDLTKIANSNISPQDISKLTLFLPTAADKGLLYIMPSSVVEKAKKEANKALYNKENPTQEEVLNSEVLKSVLLNKNATEETKKKLAKEQFREIYNAFLESHIADSGVVKYPVISKK